MAATLAKVMEEDAAVLQPKQGSGKVFSVSRLLTKDSSAGAAPSFRVYYGVASAGAVPFLWESQPGTPKKDAAFDATMPPLTPPPSYYAAAKDKEDARCRKGGGGGKKAGILGYILPRFSMARRRTRPSASPTSSFSSASSSSSSSASAASTFSSFRGTQSPACSSTRGGGSARMHAPSSCSSVRGGRGYGSSRMHASSAFSDEEDTSAATLACFGVRAESFRALKGYRVAMTVLGSVGGGHTAAVPAQSVKAN